MSPNKSYRIVWRDRSGATILNMTGPNITELIEKTNDELRRCQEEDNHGQPFEGLRTIYRTDPRPTKVAQRLQEEDEKIAVNG